MSGARSFFQSLAHEVVQVFEFVVDALGEPAARQAIVRDLGGTIDDTTANTAFPDSSLASIKAYRDAAAPGPEADLEVLRDVLTVLDAIADNVQQWQLGPARGGEELGHALLELMATNYARHRWPRVFLFLQAVSLLEEVTTTYGVGDSSLMRMGTSFEALGKFLASPGRTLDDLDATSEGGFDVVVELLLRLGGVTMTMLDDHFEIGLLGDTLVGWDAPGLAADSPVPPTRADVISSRMISFSIDHQDHLEEEVPVAERLLVSLLYVPRHEGTGRQLFLAVGGSLRLDKQLTPRWTFTVNLRSEAGLALLIGAGSPFSLGGEDVVSVGWATQADANGLAYQIPRSTGTRLDVGGLEFSLTMASSAVEMRAHIKASALVVDAADNDGFMHTLMKGGPARLPFDLTVGYHSAHGRILEYSLPRGGPTGDGVQNSPLAGSGADHAPIIDATIPLGKHLGPITIHELALRLSRRDPTDGSPAVLAVEADMTFSAQLGPVWFRVDRLGLALLAGTGRPPAERNLWLVDAQLGVSPPLGISVNIDSGPISGGGTIFHDPAQGIYYGALTLRLGKAVVLTAIGLVATRNPDGTPGSSFIVIGTLEGLGWQIGPVTVDGLGVLFAVDRTFAEDAMRAALPTGRLRTVLFPADPVHHLTETLQSLETFFPARPGSYLAGILVKLLFGRSPILRLDLALILQWGSGTPTRLIVLGRLSSILPAHGARLLQLNLDAVGIFDSTGVAVLDAVLVDSKICGRFAITGSAAFRRVPGAGGFALAVGGFHPAFRPPDGFPALTRVTIALTTGENPKLICQAYFAVTANTVQFGANASLYAAACGFSIEGSLGFDVLVQLLPPHVLVEFRAGVQLKRGSHNLFKVTVEGAFETDIPVTSLPRVYGKATFEILWCDFSVGFGSPPNHESPPPALPAIDVVAELLAQFADVRNWQVEPPAEAGRTVSVRRAAGSPNRVLIHPLGSIAVGQGVVPLGLTRDIDRFGAAVPAAARRFAVTRVTVGSQEQTTTPVLDQFAPSQFFDLTDDERLAAPSFEELQSGVSFGGGGYTFEPGQIVSAPFHYTDITIGPDGEAVEAPDLHVPAGSLVLAMVTLGAAALAPVRNKLSERFGTGPAATAPTLRPRGWAVAQAGSAVAPTTTTSWAEAKAELDRPAAGQSPTPGQGPSSGRVLVPTAEFVR